MPENVTSEQSAARVHMSLPAPWFAGLMAALVAAAFVAGWFLPSPLIKGAARDLHAQTPDDSHPAGETIVSTRMGKLQFTRIELAPPLEFIQQMAAEPTPRKWFFQGSPEELRNFFKTAGLSAEQLTAMWAVHAEESSDTQVFQPDDALVRGLSADLRQKIYARLGEDEHNSDQVNVFRFLGPSVETWLEEAKLPPAIVSDIKSLSYQQGPYWMFADLPLIWPKLPNIDARGRLLQALTTQQSWMVKLHVDAASDIDALSEYWGRQGRVNQVRPFLAALAETRDGQGGWTSIRSILPPFVQTHLFTFPPPSQNSSDLERSSNWTTLNFFNDKPNETLFANTGTLEEEIRANYTQIYAKYVLGDVILFVRRDGDKAKIIHSAVFIADDLIFTKNGPRSADPYLFMRLEEMQHYYPQSGKIELMYFRHKEATD